MENIKLLNVVLSHNKKCIQMKLHTFDKTVMQRNWNHIEEYCTARHTKQR